MVVYFSGTGNSRCAAEFLARQLEDEIFDAGNAIKNGTKGELHSEKPWVFAAPTYAWRLPRVFEDFIRTAHFSGSSDAYFVMTCGGDVGNAGEYTAQLCAEKGFRYHGPLEVVMPENYIAMFDVPDESEARSIVQKARPVLVSGAEAIRRGEDFAPIKTDALARRKSGVVNKGFYKMFVKADAFRTLENCTGCGACVHVCPLNNITLSGGRPVWGKICTHCMACICGCPAQAVEYGNKSVGKPRYRCPEDVLL